MKRLATLLGLALVAIGSLIGLRSADAGPEPVRAPEGKPVVEPAPAKIALGGEAH